MARGHFRKASVVRFSLWIVGGKIVSMVLTIESKGIQRRLENFCECATSDWGRELSVEQSYQRRREEVELLEV